MAQKRKPKQQEVYKETDRVVQETPAGTKELIRTTRILTGQREEKALEIKLGQAEGLTEYESFSFMKNNGGYTFTYQGMLPMARATFLSSMSRKIAGRGKAMERIRASLREFLRQPQEKKGYTPMITLEESLTAKERYDLGISFHRIACEKAHVQPLY